MRPLNININERMKSILYVGNKLHNKQTNVSSIQTLGPLLEDENYKIYYASNKVNKILRMLDMVYIFFKYRKKVDYVLIDVYSTLNFYYTLIISQLCRFYKIKYLPNLNGGNLPMRLRRNPKMSNYIFKNAYVNISPSMYLKNAFESSGYRNIKYIPNTIIIENYKYEERNFTS